MVLIIVTNRISTGGSATASIHLSVHLFPLYLLNRLTFDLDLLHVYGHDCSSPGIEGQKSRSTLTQTTTVIRPPNCNLNPNAVHLTLILSRGQFLNMNIWILNTSSSYKSQPDVTLCLFFFVKL